MDNRAVTTLDELKDFAVGEVVSLPPFVGDKPFNVRMRRPSIMVLIKSGKIPNQLLSTANKLFVSNTTAQDISKNDNFFADVLKVMDIVAEASLLEPKLQDITDAGLELTDEQYMAIFNYTQKGVNALKPFCPK